MIFFISQEQDHNLERLQSESKLLHIRLASLSEILSIQETDITKVRHNSTSGSSYYCLVFTILY